MVFIEYSPCGDDDSLDGISGLPLSSIDDAMADEGVTRSLWRVKSLADDEADKITYIAHGIMITEL